ncbi:glycosyltransferase [Maribacter polysaccharolyticus]|uniref:glycosyltransferase n=1 Tax=Maribacter polysaccharolyticus TaxID=3020831 RepID=UPI00237FAE57|nr:glycosyltransferase [Maribacter polysaccharolyticus]MDE3741495.1 glycosyltransferase [Maribacter polysaccharolyticus]
MAKPLNSTPSLVSVVITCYNHGTYLPKAIESVYAQSYRHFEVIVVDDGSLDDTKSVCSNYPEVNYVYQENAGLSAARNMGTKHINGDYVVFLDADDWLLDEALEINLNYLKSNVNAAFVSGGHKRYFEPEGKIQTIQQEVTENHYCKMLEGNFIGMHATVMYRSWVFEKFAYNTALRYCEDYDLYLQLTRSFPMVHHTRLIAVYRQHGHNMSSNYTEMMRYVLLILEAQGKKLKTSKEKKSLLIGVESWTNYYSEKIVDHVLNQLDIKNSDFTLNDIKPLENNSPLLYRKLKTGKMKYLKEAIHPKIKDNIKKLIPKRILNAIKKTYQTTGKVNLGSLNRTTPISTEFGYDRGGPVDRYYIENFLRESSSLIRGRVLEIGDNAYTMEFGGSKITKSDILHVDDSNEQATYIGDLSNAPHLPSNTFDCIVLTQTLHLIYDYKAAIETCYRILKPGGTLLLTVPGISHIGQDEWGKYWLWSFTDVSMQKIMGEHFQKDKTSINTYGNVLVASAFLYGMGLPEIPKEKLDYHDPHYQVIITVSAVK